VVVEGVYRNNAGLPVFPEVAVPTLEELKALFATVITRDMRLLTHQGFLIAEQGETYVA
jgi:hypothetical protein